MHSDALFLCLIVKDIRAGQSRKVVCQARIFFVVVCGVDCETPHSHCRRRFNLFSSSLMKTGLNRSSLPKTLHSQHEFCFAQSSSSLTKVMVMFFALEVLK